MPFWGPIYGLSEKELCALREYLDEMLGMGRMYPSNSPAGVLIIVVLNPHGRRLRLCMDYQGLNWISRLNRKPLPVMNEHGNRVQGITMFTKMYLKRSYNLIRNKEGYG